MKKIIFILLIVSSFTISCNKAKETAKDAVDVGSKVVVKTAEKGGEVVGETAATFFKSISSGVDKTSKTSVQISNQLIEEGLTVGNFVVEEGLEYNNNNLSLYFIFTKNIEKKIIIRVKNGNNIEIGRIVDTISGIKDEADYFDFQFDKKTNIDDNSSIYIE